MTARLFWHRLLLFSVELLHITEMIVLKEIFSGTCRLNQFDHMVVVVAFSSLSRILEECLTILSRGRFFLKWIIARAH